MYGIVNKGIEDLVLEVADEDTWDRIRERAGVQQATFVSMHKYDDRMTYALAGAAAEVLGMPLDEVLRTFGRHWVKFAGNGPLGELLNAFGQNLPDFLFSLNRMHTSVRGVYPELAPPEFTSRWIETGRAIEMEYRTHREGLAPFVEGLLDGLAKRFGSQIQVSHTGTRAEQGFDTFRIEFA